MEYDQIRDRGEKLLEKVGLKGRQKESVKQFSKGMRQRLGLAQALLHDPELLILDEPTDGLDPVGRSQVRDIMRELAEEGRTVFVNSHLLQEVELICDHVAILNHGQLKFSGSVDELTTATGDSDLHLEVIGQPDPLRACLSAHRIDRIDAGGSGRVAMKVQVQGQDEINQIVDTLRQNGHGIVGLSRSKKSLEDFFLDLVSKQEYQA